MGLEGEEEESVRGEGFAHCGTLPASCCNNTMDSRCQNDKQMECQNHIKTQGIQKHHIADLTAHRLLELIQNFRMIFK